MNLGLFGGGTIHSSLNLIKTSQKQFVPQEILLNPGCRESIKIPESKCGSIPRPRYQRML